MEHDSSQKNGDADSKDVLYLAGGLALIVVGAGLVIANSSVRKAVAAGLGAVLPGLSGKLGIDIGGVGADIQRYLKLRSM